MTIPALPWKVVSAGVGFRRPHERHGDLAIVAADGLCPGLMMGIWGVDKESTAKTAEMIVNAVNCHQELVHAVELAHRVIAAGVLEVGTIATLEHALKLAKGE